MLKFKTILWFSLMGLALSALPGCQGSRTAFYAFADLPYSESEVEKLKNGVAAINQDDANDFSVHLGDIKAGKNPCERRHYVLASNLLKRLNKPAFIIPGDNEWNDCPDPEPAWQMWETYFMGFEENWPGQAFKVAHQSARPENFAFVYRKCLYIGINLVGGKVHDAAEWETRLADNTEWLRQNFSTYQNKVKCAVIFGHAQPAANPPDPNQVFFDTLKDVAGQFDKPTLYLHGDGHVLELKRFLVDNLLRLELNGGKEDDWLLKVVVAPGKKQPFSFLLPVPE